MGKLLEVHEYKRIRFAGKKPGVATIKRMIDAGELPGKKLGTMYFVDVEAEIHFSGDVLLDTILNEPRA